MPDLQKAIAEGFQNTDMRKERMRLSDKWEKFGLLKGLKGDAEKGNMAQLLENEAKWLYKENRLIKEAGSTSSDIIGFQSIALPLVRRVFGGLVANNLVSVQPLSTPAGLIFYLDYKHGNTKKGGLNNKDWTAGGSVYGAPLGRDISATGAYGTGGHYMLNHSYSRYENTASVKVRASGTVTDFDDVKFDPDLSGAWKGGDLRYADIDYSEWSLSNPDTTNLKSWTLSGTAATHFDDVKEVFKRYNTRTGTVVRLFMSSSTCLKSGTTGVTMSYVRTGALTGGTSGSAFTPEFESDFSTDKIPEIDVSVTSTMITTDVRKLKVKWTPEMAQDLAAYQNVDAEALLTSILAEHMAIDIDIEILQKLVDAAQSTGADDDSRLIRYWSARPNTYVNKKTGEPISGPSLYVNLREWYETLLKPINELSNEIQRRTLRTGANFIVTSPEICTMLEQLTSFSTDFSGDPATTQYALGFEKAGTLTSRYTVYKSPYFVKNQMLVGYKGSEFGSAGAVFAPYVPLIITPTIFRYDDFTPNVGALSRFGFKVLRPDFYALVYVKDLDF